ncbi:hypothetical protein AYO40_02390 [Planctomycetaceae bacterium SCGC AG-212-D15]|nr:hypothetical protein AYO40_02390 [Planctomycetaceae bacterium SCGC AG-212-D15]
MNPDERKPFLFICGVVWLLAALDSVWIGYSDLPCPRGVDDAFYKSPAAELVQTGRLTQPSVIGYLPRAEEIFAAYPPLYQLAVAGWFALFGVSTGASVAFGHCIHLLNMALVMGVSAAALTSLSLSAPLRALAVGAAGLVYFGILRFFDRQEELAACFCFVESILYLCGRLSGVRGAALTGLLLGLAAVVSPWSGMVYGVVVLIREAVAWMREQPRPRQLAGRVAAIGIVSIAPVIAWIAWLESTSSGAFVGVFIHHLRISEATTIFDAPAKAVASLAYSPAQLPALMLTLFFFPRFLTSEARASVPTGILALFLGSTATLVLALVLRANSYNYIWLCLFLLIPCFGYLAGRLLGEAKPAERFFPVLMVGLCALVSLRDPFSLSLIARDLPAAERPGPIFARLTERIPASERVATTSRYWYCFQGRNPWRVSAIYPHPDVVKARERQDWVDWIVLPVLPKDEASEQELAERRELTKGFELVEEVSSDYSTLWPSFFREDRTWAYELYRRKP